MPHGWCHQICLEGWWAEDSLGKYSAVEGMFRETWGKAWKGGGTSCLHDASAPLITPPGHQRRQLSPKDSSSAIHHPVCPLLPTPPSSKKMDIPWAKDVKVCSGARHLPTIVTQLYKFTTKANASSWEQGLAHTAHTSRMFLETCVGAWEGRPSSLPWCLIYFAQPPPTKRFHWHTNWTFQVHKHQF